MPHVRIDEGVKRGPRKERIKPSQLENEVRQRARTQIGTYQPIHTKEQRALVIADAVQMLERGLTTDDIGKKHGVSGQAVRSWLVASPDAAEARTLFFASIQVEFADQIPLAGDPLALARAREGFAAWHKIAQVRDPRNFGPHQHITIENVGDLGDKLRRARERVIDHEPITQQAENSVHDALQQD